MLEPSVYLIYYQTGWSLELRNHNPCPKSSSSFLLSIPAFATPFCKRLVLFLLQLKWQKMNILSKVIATNHKAPKYQGQKGLTRIKNKKSKDSYSGNFGKGERKLLTQCPHPFTRSRLLSRILHKLFSTSNLSAFQQPTQICTSTQHDVLDFKVLGAPGWAHCSIILISPHTNDSTLHFILPSNICSLDAVSLKHLPESKEWALPNAPLAIIKIINNLWHEILFHTLTHACAWTRTPFNTPFLCCFFFPSFSVY